MGGGGDVFQYGQHIGGQIAQGFEFGFVGGQLVFVGQMAMHQQMRHFFKFAVFGQIDDVVATVAQIVAVFAHGAQGGVAGGHAG